MWEGHFFQQNFSVGLLVGLLTQSPKALHGVLYFLDLVNSSANANN